MIPPYMRMPRGLPAPPPLVPQAAPASPTAAVPASVSSSPGITPGQQQRWVLGAQILACAHDTIHMEGPAAFVTQQLGEKVDHLMRVDVIRWLMSYFLSFVFIIFIPCISPALYVNFAMTPSWGYTPSFIYADKASFKLDYMFINLQEFRNSLNDGGAATSSSVYLENQFFQSRMEDGIFKQRVGVLTLLLVFLLAAIRRICYSFRFGKQYFVMGLLNMFLHDPSYPMLRYMDNSLFGGTINLYKWVPCAWLATVLSLGIGVPLSIAALEQDKEPALRCLPVAAVAGYAVGRAYLMMCQVTFSLWLCKSSAQTAIVKILFESHMRRVFPKLFEAKPPDKFAVTIEDMEFIAASDTMERLLYRYSEAYGNITQLLRMHEGLSKMSILGLLGTAEGSDEKLEQYLRTCVLTSLYVVQPEDERKVHIDILRNMCLSQIY